MIHLDPASATVDAVRADPPPADPSAAGRALVERQLGVLTELAEIGMEIARGAGRCAVESLEGDAAATGPDPTLAYSRAARAVRMTIALQARLLKALPELDRAEAGRSGRMRASGASTVWSSSPSRPSTTTGARSTRCPTRPGSACGTPTNTAT
jgi:hypothetical protein